MKARLSYRTNAVAIGSTLFPFETAIILLGDMLQFLTSNTLDNSWRKPLSQYILEWNEKAITYNEQAPEPIGPTMLKTMLQQAVNCIPALRQVKNDDHQRMVRGLPPLRYDEHLSLLRSAAQTADEVRSTRRVNSTIVNVHQTDIVDDFEVYFGHQQG